MNIQAMPLAATIWCGLQEGNHCHHIYEAQGLLQTYCDSHKIGVTMTPTWFVYPGESEPGIAIGLISSPRHPISFIQLEEHAKALAQLLKEGLKQERVYVTLPDQTIVIE